MQFKNTGDTLGVILKQNASPEVGQWIQQKLEHILSNTSAKDLYLTYSLLSGKVTKEKSVILETANENLSGYLKAQNANLLEISRIYLLVRVLETNPDFFTPKVSKLIQLADTGELETFLKFLIVLPAAEAFKSVAVDALRTNIATVFDAIALNNPYPAIYFNDQQWNQMYLKAAFMQRNLNEIMEVEARANRDLTRIISDYAHERWAANRTIDPVFWRPVTNFIDGPLLDDMKRLLASENPQEVAAAVLCCSNSELEKARALLNDRPELTARIENQNFSWTNLNA